MADSEEHVLREIRRLYVGASGSTSSGSAASKIADKSTKTTPLPSTPSGIGSGLCEYAATLGKKVFPPRNKAVVMIIGNHRSLH